MEYKSYFAYMSNIFIYLIYGSYFMTKFDNKFLH